MKNWTDHLDRTISLPHPQKRIVSLCPAITETMFHLQLDNQIVGRTRFCIHPKEKVKPIINVGGTKDMKLDRIHELHPDLIIAEKEENTKEMVETLEKHYPVYVFEIQTYEDAFRMMNDLGKITAREKESNHLQEQIKQQFQLLPKANGKRAAYVIWKKPYMVVGSNTYIDSLLEMLGFYNPFKEIDGRYPAIEIEDLKRANLDYLLLATEPYPFREKHIDEFKSLLPEVEPIIVDGEMFWYGGMMLKAAPYFKDIFKNR
ncbi:ABC transporter substrate-binding protein [Ornithinibacillus gellani]|uniref:ABC transporter substrate-binding protein n=1 Tax=Ornithinibacillus gellani TaxID=2293253 RepID=UPI000F463C98|nr:helical backbone metal receptor [Ornithinibacillus gellani]TQS75366.1 ABC transporter substrate-binding protein [Ornithinibacillus gellani]